VPGAGDRAGRACSMTRSPRTSAERPGLRGSAARRLPRTPSAACRRAARHGPGHWHHAAPDEVPWIVRRWLRGRPQAPDELRTYAVQASAGRSNDSRPCSDARADKTDLHAYDGDRPKLSHRTERRLRERRCAHHGVNLATLPRDSLACGNAAGSPRCGNRSHVPQPRTDWVAAMITPTTVAVVLGGVAVLPGGRVYRVLLAWTLHLPPSAVPLVSDVRFRRSA
jgi:hypothetical protein